VFERESLNGNLVL